MIKVKESLAEKIKSIYKVEVSKDDFGMPPKKELGELAFGCFALARELKRNPNDIAAELVEKIDGGEMLEKAEAAGPYVNFYLKEEYLMNLVLNSKMNSRLVGKGSNIMVEFAHPNTHKAFHIGHLRNIITGESVSRVLEAVGNKVTRANYQGDVGMHIAKALWGIEQLKDKYKIVKLSDLSSKIEFLGEAYALGGQTYEKDDEVKEEIHKLNQQIYDKSKEIKEVYDQTRKWSLEYFDKIYSNLNTNFDRLYFESEVFDKGKKTILKYLSTGVFKKSQGAVIFEGEKHGLHNRVYINSAGLPTYEAKDVALAELQYKEFKPDRIIHVVGKEQSEYFKVIFKSLEQVLPALNGKEEHLAYGWVSLKSGKMSSRTGQVVLGEWLIEEVQKKVGEVMKDSKVHDKLTVRRKVALAAVKYAMLKIGISVDMAFDIDESISMSGDSGPYLLYIGARINSILKKSEAVEIKQNKFIGQIELSQPERDLLSTLAGFDEVIIKSANTLDPSQIAKYLFGLAQAFNGFYQECPVLSVEDALIKGFRLKLIAKTRETMNKGLTLLNIETVDEM